MSSTAIARKFEHGRPPTSNQRRRIASINDPASIARLFGACCVLTEGHEHEGTRHPLHALATTRAKLDPFFSLMFVFKLVPKGAVSNAEVN